MIGIYNASYDLMWPDYFARLDSFTKECVAKKIKKVLEFPEKRHMKKSSFFVDELGQYRILYRIFEEKNEVRFYFVGNHKEYERYYKSYF